MILIPKDDSYLAEFIYTKCNKQINIMSAMGMLLIHGLPFIWSVSIGGYMLLIEFVIIVLFMMVSDGDFGEYLEDAYDDIAETDIGSILFIGTISMTMFIAVVLLSNYHVKNHPNLKITKDQRNVKLHKLHKLLNDAIL